MEVVRKDTVDLEERFRKAVEFAKQVDVAMGFKEFTEHQLVKNSNMGHDQAKNSLAFLMEFGMIQVVREKKRNKYRIDMKKESMLEVLESMRQAIIEQQLLFNKQLKEYEIISDFIKAYYDKFVEQETKDDKKEDKPSE